VVGAGGTFALGVALDSDVGDGLEVDVGVGDGAVGVVGADAKAGGEVDAEFETFGVDVVGEAVDAGGEFFEVGEESAVVIEAFGPGVVEVDVLVAGGFEFFGHDVGLGFDVGFVEFGFAGVPGGAPTAPAEERGGVGEGVGRGGGGGSLRGESGGEGEEGGDEEGVDFHHSSILRKRWEWEFSSGRV
jgi:hypothetical protein